MAMSLENPDLTGNERLGIAANVGFFEDSTALGFTAMGVVSRNLLGMNERIAVSGGVTFSVDESSFSGNNESDNVGGRIGAQMTW